MGEVLRDKRGRFAGSRRGANPPSPSVDVRRSPSGPLPHSITNPQIESLRALHEQAFPDDRGVRINNDLIQPGDVIRCYGGVKSSRLQDFTVVSVPRQTNRANRWPIRVVDSSGEEKTIYMGVGGSVILLDRVEG